MGDGGLHRVVRDVVTHHGEGRDEHPGGQRGRADPLRSLGEEYERHRAREDDRSGRDHPAGPEEPAQWCRGDRAEESAGGADPEGESDRAGREPEVATGEQHEQCHPHQVEEVDRGRAGETTAQIRMFEQVAHPGPGPGEQRLGCLVGHARGDVEAADPEGREHERQRVHEDRHRCGQPLHQQAADGGTAHERDRPGRRQLAVGLEELIPSDQPDEERRVRRPEHDARDPGQDRDHVELAEGEQVQPVRRREAEQQNRPGQVGGDHQWTLVRAVIDPRADEQRGQVRRPDRGGQEADLAGGGVEQGDGDQRQGEFGDAVAELGHALRGPKDPEAVVPPETGGGQGPHGVPRFR